MKIYGLFWTLLFSGSLQNTFAWESAIRVENRCEEDDLNALEGRRRSDWAKNCGYISARTRDYNIFDDEGKDRARPYYPSFSNPNNFNDWWRAPVESNANCYREITKKYSHIVTCLASCYTPDQMLMFEEGEVAIKDAFDQKLARIVTLAENSTLEDLSFIVRDLDSYSESIRDVKHEIFHLRMESGGELKVTGNHPILLSSGIMKEAKDVSLADSLIKYNGDLDRIQGIQKREFFGKVYNVNPKSSSRLGQIVVAQGYLNGSLWYQNTGAMYINRLILRDSIPSELI